MARPEKSPKPASAMSRVEMEAKVWSRTHNDYKGTTDGERSIMLLRNDSSCIVPLSKLTDDELRSRL